MDEIYNAIGSLLNHLVYELQVKNQEQIYFRDDYRFQMPLMLIDLFTRVAPPPPAGYDKQKLLFNGIQLIPGYEMAIVLYHTRYPWSRDENDIVKIPLDPPVTTQEAWYSKTIMIIREHVIANKPRFLDN